MASVKSRSYGLCALLLFSAAESSTSVEVISGPGRFTCAPRFNENSGPKRNRKKLLWETSSRKGDFFNLTITSVASTGIYLPARIKKGTPRQRQESMGNRTAA